MALTLPAEASPAPRPWWRPSIDFKQVRTAARTAAGMPLGAQQLKRQRTSTLLSLAGVTAALVVIFAQLGVERSVYDSSVRLHRALVADLILVPPGFRSLQLHAEVPGGTSDVVAVNPNVAEITPLWFGLMSIQHSGMPVARRVAWYAIDVERPAIDVPGLRENLYKLRSARRMLYDKASRPYFGNLAELADSGEEILVLGPPTGRQLLREMFVVGNISIGPNVVSDGAVLMSEVTMNDVFGQWWSERVAFIGIKLVPGVDPEKAKADLSRALRGRAEVITKDELQKRERNYWARETPVGYITDLGFILGLMIGMVFIYYAQYQIIRFYLPEYAILKSLGYDWWFFLFMVAQIGAAIITPAFLAAFALGRGVYGLAEAALHLGMSMGPREILIALIASIGMTLVSSLFAIRRLWKVDPIMLFE
jgi:putative ABC transport system permease protein